MCRHIGNKNMFSTRGTNFHCYLHLISCSVAWPGSVPFLRCTYPSTLSCQIKSPYSTFVIIFCPFVCQELVSLLFYISWSLQWNDWKTFCQAISVCPSPSWLLSFGASLLSVKAKPLNNYDQQQQMPGVQWLQVRTFPHSWTLELLLIYAKQI